MGKFSSRKFILCLLVALAAGGLRYFSKIEATHLATTYILLATAYVAATVAQAKLSVESEDLGLFDRLTTLPFLLCLLMVGISIALQAIVKLDGAQFVAINSAIVVAYLSGNVYSKT
jgi:small-conductance mechanosensitive channel